MLTVLEELVTQFLEYLAETIVKFIRLQKEFWLGVSQNINTMNCLLILDLKIGLGKKYSQVANGCQRRYRVSTYLARITVNTPCRFAPALTTKIKNMKTEEKLDLIVSLLQEVELEFNEKAELIKDIDLPLYRMLTENSSHFIKEIRKGLHTSGQLDTFKSRLKRADELLKD